MKIVLADDHRLFRAGVRALLEQHDDLEVVAEAATGEEAVHQVRSLRPDVVVMDLSMPGMNGLEATRRISALGYDVKILGLTAHGEAEYLLPLLDAGASGYLPKTSASTDLLDALRIVDGGEVYLPPRAAKMLLERFRSPERDNGDLKRLKVLSDREREVLALTASGYSAKEIGEKLFISAKTVDTCRRRLAAKLGLTHRSELVQYALKVGLLTQV